MPDEDDGLVARFLRGETAAFDELFAKYQTYVYNIVYGVVGSTEEARDLTQDVFLQVYRSLPRFRRGARFATWLYRIAANRAVDAARGSRHWRFLPLPAESLQIAHADEEERPEVAFARGLEAETVQTVLMRCPVHHRQILALRYYQDCSIEEIAEILQCTLAAAKVRLHRARQVFRENYLTAHSVELSDNSMREKGGKDAAPTSR